MKDSPTNARRRSTIKLRANRKTERAGVNAARSLFESNGCVFQEVELGNDYGKDAYVDLTDGDEVTGLTVALQIKAGASYARGSDFAIPVEGHEELWRSSTVPIAGIVFDPTHSVPYWCDISGYLKEHRDKPVSEIPVYAKCRLTAATIHSQFKSHFRQYANTYRASLAILQVTSSDDNRQIAAMQDCFAAGRADARILIVLRYLLGMLSGEPLKCAIVILSHATPHPDIVWRASNWIPSSVSHDIRAHFRWTVDEVVRALAAVEWEEWQRGDVGQCLYMLLCEDPDIEAKIEDVITVSLANGDEHVAWTAVYLSVYWAGENARAKYKEITSAMPMIRGLPLAAELEDILGENTWVSLF